MGPARSRERAFMRPGRIPSRPIEARMASGREAGEKPSIDPATLRAWPIGCQGPKPRFLLVTVAYIRFWVGVHERAVRLFTSGVHEGIHPLRSRFANWIHEP